MSQAESISKLAPEFFFDVLSRISVGVLAIILFLASPTGISWLGAGSWASTPPSVSAPLNPATAATATQSTPSAQSALPSPSESPDPKLRVPWVFSSDVGVGIQAGVLVALFALSYLSGFLMSGIARRFIFLGWPLRRYEKDWARVAAKNVEALTDFCKLVQNSKATEIEEALKDCAKDAKKSSKALRPFAAIDGQLHEYLKRRLRDKAGVITKKAAEAILPCNLAVLFLLSAVWYMLEALVLHPTAATVWYARTPTIVAYAMLVLAAVSLLSASREGEALAKRHFSLFLSRDVTDACPADDHAGTSKQASDAGH